MYWREKYKHGKVPTRNAIICFRLFNRDSLDLIRTENMSMDHVRNSDLIVSFDEATRMFRIHKDRFGYTIQEIASKFLGFELTNEGKFLNEQEELLFILRIQ